MSRYRGPRLRVIRRLGELPGLSRKRSPSRLSPWSARSKPQEAL